jgi:hemerythrin
MEFIQWEEKLSVNNSLLDSQHKKLISLINELYININEGKDKSILTKILDDLIVYTIEHFSSEEKFMQENDYPLLNQHKADHKFFTEKVIAMKNSHDSGESLLRIEVIVFLYDWLIDHIEGEDMKYRPKIVL